MRMESPLNQRLRRSPPDVVYTPIDVTSSEMGESTSDLDKGKYAEHMVFAELVRRGAEVYTPIVDRGIDAVIRRKDGSYAEIQVKATEAYNQAGYFNVPDLDDHLDDPFYIVCVDMNKENSLEKAVLSGDYPGYLPKRPLPNVWVLNVDEFRKFETSGHRLPIYESRKPENKKPYLLLSDAYMAWDRLTA